jgi:hypothetical protein
MITNYFTRRKLKFKGAKRNVFLVILSLLALSGLTPAATARAAQAQTQTIDIYSMDLPLPLKPFCVGGEDTFPAEVRMSTRTIEADSTRVVEIDHHAVGALIEASVVPADLGTLSPTSVQTSSDVDYGRGGAANFTFHGDKAGSGAIKVKAEIDGREVSAVQLITVENCKYLVTISAVSVVLGGTFTMWTGGLMQTEIEFKDGQYKGSGSMKFQSGFRGECAIDYTLFQVPTTITGPEIQNDKLTLTFKFDPASLVQHASCYGVSETSNHTIDLSNLHLPPATFPSEGGFDHFNVHYAGSDAGDSTVNITVVPIK